MNGDLHLDLMKRGLTDVVHEDPGVAPWQPPEFSRVLRLEGKDWPRDAHTMVGGKRLENLQACVDDHRAVPGCRQAVDDFRAGHGIVEPIQAIDWAGAYWRRDG